MLSMHGGAAQARFDVHADSEIGACRRAAQRLAQTQGFDETAVGRVGIVATELATNLVRHAGGGELLLQVLEVQGELQLELIAIDRGPGMSDVQRCLQDGYSTGGTLGAGLGAVTRLSCLFDIYSIVGQGTIVMARIARDASTRRPAAPAQGLELGAICVPMPGEIECGDGWQVASEGASAAMLVVDGLGHGAFAAMAARAAIGAFESEPFRPPLDAIQHMHRAMSGTRGAAAACARLQGEGNALEYAGIGNISGSVISSERSQGMVSHNGTLGTQLLRVQQFGYLWPRDARVVMHSDGISARWSVAAYEGLRGRHSAVIAAVLYRDHRRGRDDATVLVVGPRTERALQ
jgi:anti-sigma regulatory factor (Ser/Thr protein kinase)